MRKLRNNYKNFCVDLLWWVALFAALFALLVFVGFTYRMMEMVL